MHFTEKQLNWTDLDLYPWDLIHSELPFMEMDIEPLIVDFMPQRDSVTMLHLSLFNLAPKDAIAADYFNRSF
jgi:hypothetical protein